MVEGEQSLKMVEEEGLLGKKKEDEGGVKLKAEMTLMNGCTVRKNLRTKLKNYFRWLWAVSLAVGFLYHLLEWVSLSICWSSHYDILIIIIIIIIINIIAIMIIAIVYKLFPLGYAMPRLWCVMVIVLLVVVTLMFRNLKIISLQFPVDYCSGPE